MFSVDWLQHPVGHGGFHTGRVLADGATAFTWIFDCGSRRTAKFDTYLRGWTNQNRQAVDWLFISHFDTDHVSGLDTLMARTVVNDVMVPYLNQREMAYLLLYEIGRGNLDRAVFELAADPAAFFLSRGARRVTFLGGRGPGEERPGGAEIRPDAGRDGQGWTTKIHPSPRTLQPPGGARPGPDGGGAIVRTIDGGECDIHVARGPVGLRLKPYRAPVQPYRYRGLIRALQARIGVIPWRKMRPGLGDLAYAVGHYARTATGRASLRSLFKTYVGSSNRSSLSLLTVPIVEDGSAAHWQVARPFAQAWGSGVAGWLNTGDAELLAAADLSDWQSSYAADLGTVRVLALPHHGSDRNSDSRLQSLCPTAMLAAHVKSGSPKHPGPVVTRAAGNRLACVTEQPGSQVQMWFHGP